MGPRPAVPRSEVPTGEETSLATLLALTVFLIEERAARDRRPVVQLALLAAGAAGLYTHYYLAFVIAGFALARAGRLAVGRARGDTWRRLLVTHVAMAALFAPWLAVVGALACITSRSLACPPTRGSGSSSGTRWCH